MKKIFDIEIDNVDYRYYTRVSRTNSRNKNEEGCPISKIEDFQTSISSFSTRIESKKYNISNNENNKKNKKKKDEKRKVEFNPLITVVNIESFKKENYEGTFDPEGKYAEEVFNNNDNVKIKCLLCSIF